MSVKFKVTFSSHVTATVSDVTVTSFEMKLKEVQPTNHAGLSLRLYNQYFEYLKNTRAICCKPMQCRVPPVVIVAFPAPAPSLNTHAAFVRSNFVGQLPPDRRGAWLRQKFYRDLALTVYMRYKTKCTQQHRLHNIDCFVT